jgi:hypothetical protein
VVLLDNKQKSDKVEVEPQPSPRSQTLNKPKSEFEQRKQDVKELLGDIPEEMPF